MIAESKFKKPSAKLAAVASKRLDEKRYEGKLACGMKFVFAPRKGFDKKLAFVVSDYGSLDREWKTTASTSSCLMASRTSLNTSCSTRHAAT